jgi:hypothetical protein
MLAASAEEFDPTYPGLFAGDPPAEFVPLLEHMAANVRRESLRTEVLVMAEPGRRDLLPRIAVPTLLIWSEQDVRSPLSIARKFEQAIPDARLVVIRDCGHVSNLEQPELFNEAVREFCRAHPARNLRRGTGRSPVQSTPSLQRSGQRAKATPGVARKPLPYPAGRPRSGAAATASRRPAHAAALLPRRGPEPERRRGGKRQHRGERDRPALPDDGPQGGRHDTTGGGEEQCASSPNTDRDASSCTRAREG